MRTELKNNRLIIYFSEELDNYAITQLKDECTLYRFIQKIIPGKPAGFCTFFPRRLFSYYFHNRVFPFSLQADFPWICCLPYMTDSCDRSS